MSVRPSLLCPLDGSSASVAALRYAAALAEHFVTRVIVLSVQPSDDPERDSDAGRKRHERSLAAFVDAACGDELDGPMCEFECAYGTPSVEILRVARERTCDLIVIGASAFTQPTGRAAAADLAAALRPALVIPATAGAQVRVADIRAQLRRIVAPGGRLTDSLSAVIGLVSA